jgi:O-antigen ligase
MHDSVTGAVWPGPGPDPGRVPGPAPAVAPRRAVPAATRPRAIRLLDLALAALVFTFVWRFQDLFPILSKVKFTLAATLFGFGWFVVDNGLARVTTILRHRVVLLTFAILAAMLLSVPMSLYAGLSFRFIVKDFSRTLILMLVIAAGARTFLDVERLAVANVFGAAVFAFVILTRFHVGSDGRLGDFGYYDSNDLGLLVVGTLPLAVYLLRRGVAMPLRLFAAGCLALFVLTIVKTGSRGAFLALLGVGLYMVFAYRAIPAKIRFGAVGAAFVFLMVFAGPKYWDMMRTLMHPTQDYNWKGKDTEGRMAIWQRGIGYMMSRPLTGVGVRAFSTAEGTLSPQAQLQKYGQGIKWSAAHNSFVEIGAELGFPGLLLFIWILAAAFGTLRRVAKRATGPPATAPPARALAQALTASLLGYCIAGFFLSQAYMAFLYVLFGMVVALAKVSLPRKGRAKARRAPAYQRRPAAPLLVSSQKRI